MSLLLSLPHELLVDILSYLPYADLKALRSASHVCSGLATPIIFQEVPFHFEPGGCTTLGYIARAPHLAPHVRAIRLQRAKGMHHFDDYDAWEGATIYEHLPDEERFGPSPPPSTDATLMSRGEWDALGAIERQSLYDEYQQAIQATDQFFARFASAVLAAVSSEYSTPLSPRPADSDAAQLLRCYRMASTLLRNVRTFSYLPAYRVDELGWGTTWRNIAFHVFALAELGWGNDPYYDAIQLFAALAFSQFPKGPLAIRSLTLTTLGSAFWTLPHLIRLLYWMCESPERRSVSVPLNYLCLQDAVTADGWEYMVEQVEHLMRALIATEQHFVYLVRLECRIDTLWDVGGRLGEQALALKVARCIRKARGLEWLSLAFGEDVHVEGDPAYYFTEHRRPDVAHTAAISRHLLGAIASLRHVRHLHLSLLTVAPYLLGVFRIIPQLTSLRLSHMALLSGSWDDVVVWIKDHLTLDSVELIVLEDIVQGQPRILLDPRGPAWISSTVPENWYDDYKEDIRRFVLRMSSVPLVLSPDEYIANRLRST